MHARARGVGHGIASVRVLGKGSPQVLHSSTKNIFFCGDTDCDLLLLEQWRRAILWMIVLMFAERDFRLLVNRNFDTIFDLIPSRTVYVSNIRFAKPL